MGFVMNYLIMRELMKKQDMNPVGNDDVATFNAPNDLGTVKLFDNNDTNYKKYLALVRRDGASISAFPKILDIADLKSNKMVKFEPLEAMDGSEYTKDFITGMKTIPNVLVRYLNSGRKAKASDEEGIILKAFEAKYNPVYRAMLTVYSNLHEPPSNIRIVRDSFMKRKNGEFVLVDPFIPKK